MSRCAPRNSRFAITDVAASFRAMQLVALLTSALAFFDAPPAAKPNPDFNPVVLVCGYVKMPPPSSMRWIRERSSPLTSVIFGLQSSKPQALCR